MDYKELNEKMIESFLETFKKLEMNLPPAEYVEAFRKVPRHLFTPYVFEENDGVIKKRMFNYRELQESQLKQVYVDAPIIVMIENDEVVATSSQPFVMAMMLVDAKVKEGGRVLEIGTGSGYNAAVLSEITGGAKNVFTTEIKKSVAELAKENLKRAGYGEVEVSASDGGGGYDPGAPYDSVIITCGAPEIPMHSQVKTGGTISLPLVTRGMETLCSLTKGEDGVFRGYLTIFVRFLHFEGIYSDKKQFAKNISSLQRVVESYGKKRNDVKELMADIFADEGDSDEIKKAKRTLRTCFQFYLAISDDDAILYQSSAEGRESGYALWHTEAKQSNSGLSVMFPNEVVSWGNEDVTERLLRRYKEWSNLGRPEPADYSVEFFAPGKNPPEEKDGRWVVKRKIGATVFSLKNKS